MTRESTMPASLTGSNNEATSWRGSSVEHDLSAAHGTVRSQKQTRTNQNDILDAISAFVKTPSVDSAIAYDLVNATLLRIEDLVVSIETHGLAGSAVVVAEGDLATDGEGECLLSSFRV